MGSIILCRYDQTRPYHTIPEPKPSFILTFKTPVTPSWSEPQPFQKVCMRGRTCHAPPLPCHASHMRIMQPPPLLGNLEVGTTDTLLPQFRFSHSFSFQHPPSRMRRNRLARLSWIGRGEGAGRRPSKSCPPRNLSMPPRW